jgi:4-carboxymuconolactone decarboxylase
MSNDPYEEGLKIRKAVLGEDHVNRALASVNSFNAPLQQLTAPGSK